jgi:hypothetical protein
LPGGGLPEVCRGRFAGASKFVWFGDIHGPKPYKFIGFG